MAEQGYGQFPNQGRFTRRSNDPNYTRRLVMPKGTGAEGTSNDSLAATLADDYFWNVPTAGGVTGTAAVTNANDTSTASGSPVIVGTSATTNANDTSTASGSPVVAGTSNTANTADTSAASGTTTVTGTSATTNNADTSTASGSPVVSAGSATTNADDTATASGSAGGGTVTGTAAVTNADDLATASGSVGTPSIGTRLGNSSDIFKFADPPVTVDEYDESLVLVLALT